MKQFLLNTGPDAEGRFALTGDDYHYLVRVRRLKKGASFPALLPGGRTTLIQVESTQGGVLVGSCREPEQAQAEAGAVSAANPRIVLFQALPRSAKMDLIVRQAAEGAVSEVVPFLSAYSLPRGKDGKKTERWRRIIREGTQQSGSALTTALHETVSFEEALAYWASLKEEQPRAAAILFHQVPLAQGSLHGYLYTKPDPVIIAVGPEGGFSPEEAGRFIAAGFKPVTLGNTVFRVETAALYCAAAVRVILLENPQWMLKQKTDQAALSNASAF